MNRTPPLSRMASTHGGMRRILKRRPAVVDYIRQSVQAGTYRNPNQRGRPNNRRVQQQRYDPRNPYPVAYEILSMNPPLPEPPRIPRPLRKERARSRLPTDRLVRSFLRRHDDRVRSSNPPTGAEAEEARYARLFGLTPAAPSDAMGQKSTVVANAYTFALRQYELLREDEVGGGEGRMTEEESVEAVERLLAEEARAERRQSREAADAAQGWRKAKDAGSDGSAGGKEGKQKKGGVARKKGRGEDASSSPSAAPMIPSILTGKPRTIRAMNVWARRLAAVPYGRWTVGAATALDHWIAVDVLGLSEESWDKVLTGDDGEDDEVMAGRGEGGSGVGVGASARARDVVAVRAALFPETLLYADGEDGDEEGDGAFGEDDKAAEDKTQNAIDELLKSLSDLGDGEDDEDFGFASSTSTDEDALADAALDEKIASMVEALQEWRAKQAERPYEQWAEDDRSDFDEWLSEYVALLSNESDGKVNLKATREALLSEPPLKREESDEFWSNVRDETQAEIFLSGLRAKDAKDESLVTFLELPHDVQVRRLVDLGTLRPLFDEYTPESSRIAFLQRYAETLLEGTEVEHLIPDHKGPISADDLGGDQSLVDKSEKGSRFRMEKIMFGTDEYGTARSQRARKLYRAWNEHKAGRAKYEEAMFRKGKIGLAEEPVKKQK